MPQINSQDFSFEKSLYLNPLELRVSRLPKVSYLSPVRGHDETTLGKIFPKFDINKSIAHSLAPKIRGHSKVLSPFVYRQTLFAALKKFEAMDGNDFRDIISILRGEKERQELFVFYQNALFAA